ncbi:MAG: hypothetical protein WCO09_03840 [bacterium]
MNRKPQETQEPQIYCVICQEDSQSSKADEAKKHNGKVAAETVAVARKIKALVGTRPIRLLTGCDQRNLISSKILGDELDVDSVYSNSLSNGTLEITDAKRLIREHIWDRNTAYVVMVENELDGATFLYAILKELFNHTDMPHAKRVEMTQRGWKVGMRTGSVESIMDATIPVECETD